MHVMPVGGAGAATPLDPHYSQFNTIWNLQASGEDILGHPYSLIGSASFETATPPGNYAGYVRLPTCGSGGDYIECRLPADDSYGASRYQMSNHGCIEFWYRHTGYTASTTHPIFAIRRYNSLVATGTGFSFHHYGPSNTPYIYNQNSSTIYGGNIGTAMAANTWHHCRLCFSQYGCYFFKDGVHQGYINTGGYCTPVAWDLINQGTIDYFVSLGRETQGLGDNPYECWFAGLRITPGHARDNAATFSAPLDPHPLDATGYLTTP